MAVIVLFASISAQAASAAVKVTLKDTYMAPELHVPQPEAPQVVAVLEKLLTAAANGDSKAYAEFLTNDTAQYDDKTKKEIVGKDKVMAALKAKLDAAATESKSGSTEIVAERPYVKVSGEMAIVSFKLITKKGSQLYTNIFSKTADGWKKSFDRGS